MGRQTVQIYTTNQKPGNGILIDPKTGDPDFERTLGKRANTGPKGPKRSEEFQGALRENQGAPPTVPGDGSQRGKEPENSAMQRARASLHAQQGRSAAWGEAPERRREEEEACRTAGDIQGGYTTTAPTVEWHPRV